jgi:hypothetical protein
LSYRISFTGVKHQRWQLGNETRIFELIREPDARTETVTTAFWIWLPSVLDDIWAAALDGGGVTMDMQDTWVGTDDASV